MEDSSVVCKVYFLNGVLEEKVCIEKSLGYEVKMHEDSFEIEKGTLWVKASSKSLEKIELTSNSKKMASPNVLISTLYMSKSKIGIF